MRGQVDYQRYVDLLVPLPAKIKLVRGAGPVYLNGSHCVEYYGYRGQGGNYEESEEEDEEMEEEGDEKEDLRKKLDEKESKKRKASADPTPEKEKKAKPDSAEKKT